MSGQSGFEAAIFDMDGTITEPVLDFDGIRRELGISSGDIVDHIDSLPPPEREKAWRVVESREAEATENQRLQAGAIELLEKCRSSGIKLALVTRNTRRSVDCLCDRFGLKWDAVLTREFPHRKPSAEPVLHVLRLLGARAELCLVVGDYIHDIQCGRAAGTSTCFFQNEGKPDYGGHADFTARSMKELDRIIFSCRIGLKNG